MNIEPFWEKINNESILRQGDLLKDCFVPIFNPDFAENDKIEQNVLVNQFDLIIVTQSCDLEQNKVRLVALCPIYPITEFEKVNPKFCQRGKWEEVRKGRIQGLYLLGSLENPENNREALVVDFREIYSLPYDYLVRRTTELNTRWRLRSPFLEHFSQAFARHFMRVGLPSDIPPFK